MLDDINIIDQKITNNFTFYVSLIFKKEEYYIKALEILENYSKKESFHNNNCKIIIESQEFNRSYNKKEINFNILAFDVNSYYKIKDFVESIIYRTIKIDNKIKIEYIHIKNQLLFGEKNILSLFKLKSNKFIYITIITFIAFCVLGFILIKITFIKAGWFEITFSIAFSTILALISFFASNSNAIERKIK